MERNGENAGMKQYGALFLLIRKADWGGWAATINVPADQPTIQAGIDASTSGDTVLVEPKQWHKFHTLDGAIFEEVSTTHFNNDSFYEDERISRLPREARKTEVPNWSALV
jgi:hypothetical protein